ncbi:MAG TPA: fibronectin type III domain-containing protein [Tepidisphaeraceae bacterium]|nr:fibronectin type III domain-containing protein [Tepidisphaeraceae bacterium]
MLLSKSRRRQIIRAAGAIVQSLEARLLMHFDPNDPDHFDPVPMNPILKAVTASPHKGPFKSAAIAASIPALNSDEDATAQLYLDFNGAAPMSWGSFTSAQTPAYDTDNDPSTFTAGELSNIQQIWARVAEIYSPFNINVTTVDPGNLTDRVTTRVIVGGDGAWYGAAGGVAYVGAFYNSAPNIAWVFPKMLANGNVKYTADAISHEAGHTFGLQHQSTFNGSSKTNEYNPGTSAKAPIMGNSYSAARSLWWKGPSSLGASVIQDDVAVLSGANDAFGYRPDDHGNSIAAAGDVSVNSNAVLATGIIEQLADKDFFDFSTLMGTVSFTVSPAAIGGNLDATLTLYNSSGVVITTANTGTLGETISANVAAGQYFLAVGSHGSTGDLGQYTLSGTIVTSPNFVATPANLAAIASNGQVNLSWSDMSWNETGFEIGRSDDGGSTWNAITTIDAGVTHYTDAGAEVGSNYIYRVMAIGELENSDYSNHATVAVTPAIPIAIGAIALSASQINLTWHEVDGATGYRVDRSANNSTWTTVATVGAILTSYTNTDLTSGTRYYYRIVATSGAGNSLPSQSVSGTTRPLAPVTLVGAATAISVGLSWTNVGGETGYKIERSLHGDDWTQVGTTAANAVAFTNTGLSANTTYYYRVKATNAGGDSLASSNLTKLTLMAAPTGFAAAVAGTTQINLNWNDSDGETGYKVERLVGTAWTQVGNILDEDTDSLNVTGLVAGTAYSFRIRAINDAGISLPSTTATGTTIPPAPATLVATAISTSQIKLTWSNVAGETGFKIDRSANGSDWSQLATTAANIVTYTDSALSTNTVYYYRVKAYSAAGNGEATGSANTRTLLAAPTGLAATATSTSQINLTWNDVEGETGYRLEKLSGTAWVQVGNILDADTTEVSVNNLAAGTAYSFRLRAINSGGASAQTATAAATTVPPAPTLAATVFSNTQINLSWTNVAGETGYKIERSADGSDWSQISTTAANVVSFASSSLTANTTYYYRVRATNAAGDSAYSSSLSRKTLLAAPEGLTKEIVSSTAVNLSWTDSDGATGYKVERLSGTAWVQVGAILGADTTTLAVTGLVGGTSYSFRVRALNEAGASAPSLAVAALTKPAAPASLISSSPLAGSIKLTWANVAGETGFKIERSSNGSDWSQIATAGVNVLTYTDSGLAGGTYFYRVKSYNASGDSTASPTTSLAVSSPVASPTARLLRRVR